MSAAEDRARRARGSLVAGYRRRAADLLERADLLEEATLEQLAAFPVRPFGGPTLAPFEEALDSALAAL